MYRLKNANHTNRIIMPAALQIFNPKLGYCNENNLYCICQTCNKSGRIKCILNTCGRFAIHI